eukprot:8139650-Alexandrium_andersonii.AAC.1
MYSGSRSGDRSMAAAHNLARAIGLEQIGPRWAQEATQQRVTSAMVILSKLHQQRAATQSATRG